LAILLGCPNLDQRWAQVRPNKLRRSPNFGASERTAPAKLTAAIERLGAQYFQGLKVIFKSDADALYSLAQRAAGLVSDYNKLVGFLEAIPFQPGVFEGTHRIDLERIEQAAQEEAANLARKLVALAQAEAMLDGQDSEAESALELLRPMLKAEIEACA
jgi:hypothetical protein